MAIELEKALQEILTKLPEGHPDRRIINAHFKATLAYNEQAGDKARLELDRKEGIVHRMFSLEARQALDKAGCTVCRLTGRSIRNLQFDGWRFYKIGHRADFGFEYLPSRESQVAINPKELFLPHSQERTLDEQEIMVARLSRYLAEKIPGVKAIIGEIPDYAELNSQCLAATGHQLFDPEIGNFHIRTKTPIDDILVADIGPADPDRGLYLGGWPRDQRDSSIAVVPLFVPA